MVQAKNLLAPVALLSSVFAETISIRVGPGDSFSPETVTAKVGDIVEYSFSRTHNVAFGKFDEPCKSSSSDIFSGDMSSGKFSVKINSTDPMYFYCGYSNHCQVGMVGAINPSDSIDDYKSAAEKTSSSDLPSNVQGGIVGDASLFGETVSTTSKAASSSASAKSSSLSSKASSLSAAGSTSAASSAAASATSAGAATGITASATSTSSGSAATNIQAWGVAGFAGVLAAIVA